MTDDAYKPHASRDDAAEARYHRAAFVVMMALFIVAPAVVYPVFVMKALCFALFACAFNLLIGFGGLLSFGHAMFLGMAGYVVGARGQGLGASAGTRDPRGHGRLDRARGAHRTARHPPPGHLLRDDHARARPDGLLLLPAGAVHRRRGRHPVRAAREVPRAPRPERARWSSTTSCSPSSRRASSSSTASSIRPSARC